MIKYNNINSDDRIKIMIITQEMEIEYLPYFQN